MKRHNIIAITLSVLTMFFALSTTAYAYSDIKINLILHDYSSYFPVVVGGMLIIEGIIILLLTDIKRIVNVSFAVLVANAASFALPRFVVGLLKHEVFYKGMITQGLISSPVFAAIAFLLVSLIIELPILYFMLRVFTKKTARLMVVATAANILTTAAFIVFELQIHRFIA